MPIRKQSRRSYRRFYSLCAFSFFALAASGSARADQTTPSYTLIDLGTLGGTSTFAVDINETGRIVGYGYLPGDAEERGFLYANGGLVDLGTLGGTVTYARAINEAGQITGASAVTNDAGMHAFVSNGGPLIDLGTFEGGAFSLGAAINAVGHVVGRAQLPLDATQATIHAFFYAGGPLIDLGTFGGTFSDALAMNDADQVTGSASTPAGLRHAFLFTDGTLNDLGTLGGRESEGAAINTAGHVTGWARTSDNRRHAFVYHDGTMIDIHALTSPESAGAAINDAGQVTGTLWLSSEQIHGFVYQNGVMSDLGTLGGQESQGMAINAAGHVTGWSYVVDRGTPHAFLYSDGVMRDVNTLVQPNSGLIVQAGLAINDKDQIVGYAHNSADGRVHAVLLTPNVRPAYEATVLAPINADGSSVFKASRGVVPVKFLLSAGGSPTCDLPPATIVVSRIDGTTTGGLDEGEYLIPADDDSNFRITDCAYLYNLAASSLGAGSYRVNIRVNGSIAGEASFRLK